MSKSSRPSRRRQEQLDSLYWAGRAKQLGLTRQDAVKKAQLEAEALARVTARITQPAARGNGYAAAPRQGGKDDFIDALLYASTKFANPSKPFTIKRPGRYVGKSANFLIVDDLVADDLVANDLIQAMKVGLS